jgi:tetratricopeptide (TPR) repeat protein
MTLRWAPVALLLAAALALGLSGVDRPAVANVQEGDALAAGQHYGAALDAYQAAAQRCPGCAQPRLRQGEVYLAQSRYGEAQAAILAAVRAGGLDDQAREALVRLYLARQEGSLAAGALQDLLARRPGRSDLWVPLGEAYLAAGKTVQAQEAFERALGADLDAAQRQAVHLQLGMLCVKSDARCALDHLLEVEQGPDQEMAGSVSDLISALQRFVPGGGTPDVQVDPAFARAKLGEALFRHGDLEPARRQLEAAVALEPAYADVHAYLGHVLSLQGEDEAAVRHLEEAAALEPGYTLPLYFLGMHYAGQGRWITARDYFMRAYEIEPGNPAICAAVAETYMQAQDSSYTVAEQWLHAAVDSAPGDLRFHLLLAHFYVDAMVDPGGWGVTVADFAARMAPDSSEAQETLGWAYYLSGDAEGAVEPLRRALELNPSEPRIAYRLGETYRALGRPDLARPFYQQAIDLDWNGPVGERAREAIAPARP